MLKKALETTAVFLAIFALCSTAWADVHTNRGSSRSKRGSRVERHSTDRDKRVVRRDRHDRRERRRRLVRKYIPGHYETVLKRVWHEGYWETFTVPAIFEDRVVIVTDTETGEMGRGPHRMCPTREND
ncbi:MAG: hypothetical protein U5N86_03850 [Planctomycetota bacterium]|nr:hypothetical protein [Planctomycetota bacterium]